MKRITKVVTTYHVFEIREGLLKRPDERYGYNRYGYDSREEAEADICDHLHGGQVILPITDTYLDYEDE